MDWKPCLYSDEVGTYMMRQRLVRLDSSRCGGATNNGFDNFVLIPPVRVTRTNIFRRRIWLLCYCLRTAKLLRRMVEEVGFERSKSKKGTQIPNMLVIRVNTFWYATVGQIPL